MSEPASSAISTSADYLHIDVALKSLWQPFNELVAEMDSFRPRPLSDYEAERRKVFELFRRLNPAATVESLTKLADDQIVFTASDRIQFADRFSNRFMTQYVTVALLAHALCEAAINAILAIGLAKRSSPELFSVLEKAEVKEKWRVGPKSFFPGYELNPGTALFETINHLTKRRNALVHSKIHLQIGGTTVLQGSKFERLSFQENTRWMRRFFSIPYDLVAHASSQLTDPFIVLPLDRVPIIEAAEHTTKTLPP